MMHQKLQQNTVSCPLHHRLANNQVQYCYINAQISLLVCTLVTYNHHQPWTKMHGISHQGRNVKRFVLMLSY